MMEPEQFLGPFGLTLFLLLLVSGSGGVLVWAGKMILDTQAGRIEKVERLLDQCRSSHHETQQEMKGLIRTCGELEGQLKVLEQYSPKDLVAEVSKAIRDAWKEAS